MAVVLMEGWDHFSAAQVSLKGWSAVSSLTTGRFAAPVNCANSQAARFTNTTTLRQKSLPSNYATLIMGTAFRATNTGGPSGRQLALRAAAVNAVGLSMDATSHLAVLNSANTTIATGTTVLNPNVWYYIEMKAFINGASGTVEVHLDGSVEIASTVVNIGSSNIDNVALTGLTTGSVDWDDIYVCDTTGSAPQNTFLGVVRVTTPMPTGVGAHSQWTPVGASPNFACVNEFPPDSDTTYVGDLTPNDLDSYATADVDGGATVYAVQANLFAEKDDAATRQVAPLIRQAGTDYTGTTFTMASTYNFYSQIYNQDPTGSNWTPTVFNGDEFGIQEIA